MPTDDHNPTSPSASNNTSKAPIPKPSRFAWPPVPSSDASNVANEKLVEKAHLNTSPNDATTPSIEPTPRRIRRHAADASGQPSPLSWWNTIEEVWLGVVRPTWKQRRVESQWLPESHGIWCPKCGHSAGDFDVATDDNGATLGCSKCQDIRVPWQEVVRLGTYEGLLRDAVLEIKFTAWRTLASDVGYDLGTQLAHSLASRSIPLDNIVLIPVPVALRRRLLRGIDHTLCLARGVRQGLFAAWEQAGAAPQASAAPILRPLKRRYRPTQTSRNAEQRRKNVAHSMFARSDVRSLQGKTVVLIDDVMTSGATLREACRALGISSKHKPAGFDVIVAVVAVTDDAM